MSQRRIHSPVAGVVFVAALVAVGYFQGLGQGRELRECPARLSDGRPLLGLNLTTNECRYSGIPRPLVELSPQELRTMAHYRLKAELESANRAYADVMRAVDECGSYKP